MDEPKVHILLVENDAFLSDIYRKKFEMEGLKVSICDNGEKCLKDAKNKKPDLVLLDILLPKLDGFSVLEKLKKEKSTKKIPVIMLTSLGQRDDVEKGLKLGAEGYLIRSHFKPSEIVDKIKKVLAK